MSGPWTGLYAPAGLLVAPALLAVNTQLGQILPYATCGSPWHPPALVAVASALVSLGAAWISWRAARPGVEPSGRASAYPASYPFVGRVAALSASIIAYGLLLQGVSALVLSGCER